MSSTLTIPSIAGCVSSRWSTDFCPFITEWSAQPKSSTPLKGSVGIHYSVHEDLDALWNRFDGQKEAISAYLQSTYVAVPPAPGFSGRTKPLTPAQVDVLLGFYRWAMGDQPYFFMRKGVQTIGLYRKTSGYYYDAQSVGTVRASDPYAMPHRVGFEFVREALPSELSYNVGRVPMTLIWVPTEVSAPEPSLDQQVERLNNIRSALAALTAELNVALDRFSSTVH